MNGFESAGVGWVTGSSRALISSLERVQDRLDDAKRLFHVSVVVVAAFIGVVNVTGDAVIVAQSLV